MHRRSLHSLWPSGEANLTRHPRQGLQHRVWIHPIRYTSCLRCSTLTRLTARWPPIRWPRLLPASGKFILGKTERCEAHDSHRAGASFASPYRVSRVSRELRRERALCFSRERLKRQAPWRGEPPRPLPFQGAFRRPFFSPSLSLVPLYGQPPAGHPSWPRLSARAPPPLYKGWGSG